MSAGRLTSRSTPHSLPSTTRAHCSSRQQLTVRQPPRRAPVAAAADPDGQQRQPPVLQHLQDKQQQLRQAQQQQQQDQVQDGSIGTRKKRDLVVPVLVAICIAAYALIAVVGYLDGMGGMDTQQIDWQL